MMPFLWKDLENLIRGLSEANGTVSELGVLHFKKDCQIALSNICKKALVKCPLKYSIVHNMMCLDPNTMCSEPEECLKKMSYEDTEKMRAAATDDNVMNVRQGRARPAGAGDQGAERTAAEVVCFKCGLKGHLARA
ncbi:unnamed protein product [Merluccius merluccius]